MTRYPVRQVSPRYVQSVGTSRLKPVVDQPHEFGRRVLSSEVRVRCGATHQPFLLQHLEPSFDLREIIFINNGGRHRKRLRRHWVL